MVDAEGFRPNVGIILANQRGQLLWARRVGGMDAWQFPQGGIQANESVEAALFRELFEEVGLREHDVQIMGSTRGWLRYRLPPRLVRRHQNPLCIGQKQKWYFLRSVSDQPAINFNNTGEPPEFDHWQWVNYWYPLTHVVSFKREVYRAALKELAPYHLAITAKLTQ